MCRPACGVMYIKEALVLIEKRVAHIVAAAGFYPRCLNGLYHMPDAI